MNDELCDFDAVGNSDASVKLNIANNSTASMEVETGNFVHPKEINVVGACSSALQSTFLSAIETERLVASDESNYSDDIYDLILEQSDKDDDSLLEPALKTFDRKIRKYSFPNYMEKEVPNYTEEEFRSEFRISRDLYLKLSTNFEKSYFYKTIPIGKRLPAKTYLAVFLWFAANEGCGFRELSNLFYISLMNVYRAIDRTSLYLCSMFSHVIKWPKEEKKRESAKFFEKKYGFSKAIGCIDMTYIGIKPPPERINLCTDSRKHPSITLQAICDEKGKFINAFIGHPGSKDHSFVFQNSDVHHELASLCGDYYLLGDSAYPCSQHLLTPYKDDGHLTNAQKNFNLKLNSGHFVIDSAIANLKMRFNNLEFCKFWGVKKLCRFIGSCCVLHNLANENDLDFDAAKPNEIYIENEYDEASQGNDVRDRICKELTMLPDEIIQKEFPKISTIRMQQELDKKVADYRERAIKNYELLQKLIIEKKL